MKLVDFNKEWGLKLVPSGAALMSFVLTAIMLRHGIKIPCDGWYYWQGSIKLLESHQYADFLGEPIMGWQPLFFIYLALFQVVFSKTGWTLALAMSVLSALNAWVWSAYVTRVFASDKEVSLPYVGSLLFVTFFVSLCSMILMAQTLLVLFIGALFYGVLCMIEEPESVAVWKSPVVIGLILGIASIAHNSAMIYVLATAFIVPLFWKRPLLMRLAGSSIILLLSVGMWVWVRTHLHQSGSHPLGKAHYTPIEYVCQLLAALGTQFVSFSSMLWQGMAGLAVLVGVLVLGLKWLQTGRERPLLAVLTLALLVVAGHYAVSNAIYLDDPFATRYLWTFSLAMAPILLRASKNHAFLLVVLMLMTVGVSGWRVAKNVWFGDIPSLTTLRLEMPEANGYSAYFLSQNLDTPVPAGTILIQPPLYPWQKVPPQMDVSKESIAVVRVVRTGQLKNR